MTKAEFLNKYYPLAVRACKGTGIFPQTLITQLIGESGYNLSSLATKYNNFFGIKSGSAWKGKVVSMTTKEYRADGTPYTVKGTGKMYASRAIALQDGAASASLFRVYSSIEDGFKGYIAFLQANSRYKDVFKAQSPEQQFAELKKAGYATQPNYVQYLTSIYNGIRSTLANIPVGAVATGGLLLFTAIAYAAYQMARK